MNYSIQELISLIPSLDPVKFNHFTGAVCARINNRHFALPLSIDQWAAKLDHSLAQARHGEKPGASTLTSRIHGMDL